MTLVQAYHLGAMWTESTMNDEFVQWDSILYHYGYVQGLNERLDNAITSKNRREVRFSLEAISGDIHES